MRKILLGTIASIFIFSAETSEAAYFAWDSMQSIIDGACDGGTAKIKTVISSFREIASLANTVSSDFSSNLKNAADCLDNATKKTYGVGSNSGFNNFSKSINFVKQATWNAQSMQNTSWPQNSLESILSRLISIANDTSNVGKYTGAYIKKVGEKLREFGYALNSFINAVQVQLCRQKIQQQYQQQYQQPPILNNASTTVGQQPAQQPVVQQQQSQYQQLPTSDNVSTTVVQQPGQQPILNNALTTVVQQPAQQPVVQQPEQQKLPTSDNVSTTVVQQLGTTHRPRNTRNRRNSN